MEPPIGFEPMTYGLQDRRSTSWAMVALGGLYKKTGNCNLYIQKMVQSTGEICRCGKSSQPEGFGSCINVQKWCNRQDSNLWPLPSQGSVLPAELRLHYTHSGSSRFWSFCSVSDRSFALSICSLAFLKASSLSRSCFLVSGFGRWMLGTNLPSDIELLDYKNYSLVTRAFVNLLSLKHCPKSEKQYFRIQ